MRSRVKKLRLAKGLTQEALAAALGVDRGTIWRYESGKTPLFNDGAIKLAKALGLGDPADLLEPGELEEDEPVIQQHDRLRWAREARVDDADIPLMLAEMEIAEADWRAYEAGTKPIPAEALLRFHRNQDVSLDFLTSGATANLDPELADELHKQHPELFVGLGNHTGSAPAGRRGTDDAGDERAPSGKTEPKKVSSRRSPAVNRT